MKKLILVIALLVAVFAFAQPNPDTLWTWRLNGTTGTNPAYSVQQTSDWGYIVAGYTETFGNHIEDIFLTKLNNSGDTLWFRTYGSLSYNRAYSVQETNDGGFIAAGYTSNSDDPENIYLVRTDSDGETIWTRSLSSPIGSAAAHSIKQTTDGGYIIAGTNYMYGDAAIDFCIVKTDSLGYVQWTSYYGGSNSEDASDIQQTADGGYIISGTTISFGAVTWDMYLVRINSNRDTLWTRTYDGGSTHDYGQSVDQTADGGYVLAGYTLPSQSNLVKYDSIGNMEWAQSHGHGRTLTVHQTGDEGYILFGYGQLMNIGKTNSSGILDWTRNYGVTIWDGQQTIDGGYILAGEGSPYNSALVIKTGSDPGLFLLSPNGGEHWRILQLNTVEWIGADSSGGIRIELNRNYPEGNWVVLVDSTVNDGIEEVSVTDPLSSHCRIRISTLDDTLFDISYSDFSITSSQGYLGLATSTYQQTPILSWDAGTMECPSTNSEIFSLKNFGNEAIVVFNPFLLTNTHFSLDTDCDTLSLAPGEVSVCSLTITYDPLEDGTHHDTLLIMSDAVNSQGGYVRIPLTGQQISTPAVPQVTISIEGDDARLTWDPITESVLGCSIDVTYYLIFYSEIQSGPYFYLAYTPDTTYVHLGAPRFTDTMFYQALAFTDPLDGLDQILPSGIVLTREEVLAVLKRF